jgi:tRNA-Thr(GGU) m(6)t(6)A37 methyltransferase TsaA
MEFKIEPIGIIHSPYKKKGDCPIQGGAAPAGQGQVEIFTQFEEGLATIETFSHLILLYVFDRAGEIILSRPTFLDDGRHGVFASRHPCRPNGIGFSVVKLDKREGNVLSVSEIDVLDKTPLVDVKPYIPRFDYRENASNGWTDGKPLRPKPAHRE